MASPSAGTVSYEASCIPETIRIVTSFQKRNSIPSGEVPATLRDIHAALLEIAGQAGVFEESLVQLEASASRYLGKPNPAEATVEEYLPSLRLAAFDTFGFRPPQLPAPAAAPSAPAAPAPPAAATPAPVAARPAVVPQEPAPALRAPPRKRVRPSRAKPKPAAEQPSLFAREETPAPVPAKAAPPVTAAPAPAAVTEPDTAPRKETRNERRRRTRPSRAKPKLAAPLLEVREEIEAFVEPSPAVEEAPAPTPVPTPAQRAPAAEPAPDPAKPRQKPPAAKEAKRAVVRVPAEESVQMDVLVCLEDGKKTRDLSRHLYENHSMTADEYREKWQLPASYPMVPPGLILKKGDLFEFDPISKGLNPVNR